MQSPGCTATPCAAHAVGVLMYLAIMTCPDIVHAVGILCRFMSKPGSAHWKAAKHLFCYLRGCVNYHLTYAPDPSSSQLFTTYSNADHSSNPDNSCSTSTYVVKMGIRKTGRLWLVLPQDQTRAKPEPTTPDQTKKMTRAPEDHFVSNQR
jgi:hypothetical protein